MVANFLCLRRVNVHSSYCYLIICSMLGRWDSEPTWTDLRTLEWISMLGYVVLCTTVKGPVENWGGSDYYFHSDSTMSEYTFFSLFRDEGKPFVHLETRVLETYSVSEMKVTSEIHSFVWKFAWSCNTILGSSHMCQMHNYHHYNYNSHIHFIFFNCHGWAMLCFNLVVVHYWSIRYVTDIKFYGCL